jgi:hypothetical protein
MERKLLKRLPGVVMAAAAVLLFGAGSALAAHPSVPLYTFEEIGMQFTPGFNPANPMAMAGMFDGNPTDGINNGHPQIGFMMMPVMINEAQGGKGFPYSPKMTCGNCHNGTLQRWDNGQPIRNAAGTAISTALVSYDEMNDETFHVEQGTQEWQHYGDVGNAAEVTASMTSQPGKPWSSSNGMWGKW